MTAIGDQLPVLAIEMTATRIVAGAIATRDFMPVHHDRDYAIGQGATDIFMNIISTNAYCTRYLTDWAGSDAMLKRLAIRLGVPVFPGSTLTFTGSVADVRHEDGSEVLEVEFRASNDLGDHATGTATLRRPGGPS
jgi:acyl dehydratase